MRRAKRAGFLMVIGALLPLWAPSPASASSSDPPQRFRRPVGSSGAVAGDFDNDGFGDLAIGVPGEDLGEDADAGVVHVLYGSASGLSTDGDQLFSQSFLGLGEPELGDRFGASLASGDFDGDGNSDLAIGVPGEDVGGLSDAGEVQILYGTNNGLNLGGSQTFDGNESGDRFGTVLAWANFGRGPQGDLAVGIPEENVGDVPDAGAVQVLYGSPTGLNGPGRQTINQNAAALGPAETADRFGAALAAADLGKSGLADLAIAASTEDVGDVADAGTVQVLYGTSSGLKVTGATLLTDLTPETNDQFGFSMATGNFDGLAKVDLAIGVPREDVFAIDHGVVALAFGQAGGIGNVTRLIADQAPGDGIENNDQFGRTLAANDFDRDGLTDLAVGIPFEDDEGDPGDDAQTDTGTVLVFSGTSNGRPRPEQALFELFEQSGDKFGAALTAWDFGAGPAPDLVVGVPFDNPFNLAGKVTNDAGSVQAFYSRFDPAAPLDVGNRDFFVQDGSQLPDNGESGDQFGGAVY